MSEFYGVAVRKSLLPRDIAAARANDWLTVFPTCAATAGTPRAAFRIAASTRASYWDTLLLATAADAGCTAILSEDMQDGAEVAGVRIVIRSTARPSALRHAGCSPLPDLRLAGRETFIHP